MLASGEETESDQVDMSAASGERRQGASGTGDARVKSETPAPTGTSRVKVEDEEDLYTYTEHDPEYEEEYDDEENCWAFIHGLPPLAECVAPRRPSLLPPRKLRGNPRKNTLVLDLDETLVHSNLEQADKDADFCFPVTFNNQRHNVSVRCR